VPVQGRRFRAREVTATCHLPLLVTLPLLTHW
jgi:hypothetical protein